LESHVTPETLRAADGETITRREGRDVVILVESEELTITWSRYAPGEVGTDPHVHREHTDAFYVLDGELTFGLGPDGEPVSVAAGGFVAVPPNVVHSFRNDSDAEASWLNFHAPDTGFAAYLRAARDGVPDTQFDSFDPPADGGLAPGAATVAGDVDSVTVPGLCVMVRRAGPPSQDASFSFELGDGRALDVTARR
jgi:quercetin dioxygenase-like cupin family protein